MGLSDCARGIPGSGLGDIQVVSPGRARDPVSYVVYDVDPIIPVGTVIPSTSTGIGMPTGSSPGFQTLGVPIDTETSWSQDLYWRGGMGDISAQIVAKGRARESTPPYRLFYIPDEYGSSGDIKIPEDQLAQYLVPQALQGPVPTSGSRTIENISQGIPGGVPITTTNANQADLFSAPPQTFVPSSVRPIGSSPMITPWISQGGGTAINTSNGVIGVILPGRQGLYPGPGLPVDNADVTVPGASNTVPGGTSAAEVIGAVGSGLTAIGGTVSSVLNAQSTQALVNSLANRQKGQSIGQAVAQGLTQPVRPVAQSGPSTGTILLYGGLGLGGLALLWGITSRRAPAPAVVRFTNPRRRHRHRRVGR